MANRYFSKSNLLFPFYLARALLQYKKTTVPKQAKTFSRLLVLGNGPSLKFDIDHVRRLKSSSDIMVVNQFARSAWFEELQPRYYVMADPTYNATDLKPILQENFDRISDLCSWPMHLFLPARFKPNPALLRNQEIHISYYNKSRIAGWEKLSFILYKKGIGMPSCTNVIMPSLMRAINLGYTEILLFGADFSWLKLLDVDYNNNLTLRDLHFDEKMSPKRNLTTSKEQPKGGYSIVQQARNFIRMMDSLNSISSYGSSRGAHIYNCSCNTMIQSLTRKNPALISSAER